jgi:biphenyl-2,3-diol 1,2-dioxygenase
MTDVLGLMDVSGDDGTLRFRMDDHAWRFAVQEGEAEDVAHIGFDAGSSASLTELESRLKAAGFSATRDEALAADRGVSELVTTTDSDGLAVELYCGKTENAEVPFASPAGVSGFVTGDQGLGHMVLYTPDAARKKAFYMDALGFSLSDTILMHGRLNLTFLHCNPRHHTLALAEVPVDKHLNHFMVQGRSLNDVGFACDRVISRNLLASSLGCHTNDRMVSFYAYTPSGFEVEFGYGARTIGDDWTVAHHNAPSIWGHHRQAPAS